jgi:hypothetical protein
MEIMCCFYEESEPCINRQVCAGVEKKTTGSHGEVVVTFVCPFLPHDRYKEHLGISYEEYRKQFEGL